MTLQPYDKDRPCPKCGQKGATTEYLPRPHYPYWGNCQVGIRSQDYREHLHRHCPNCHYEWCEGLAVAAGESIDRLIFKEVTE